jgi:hypothetical protein
MTVVMPRSDGKVTQEDAIPGGPMLDAYIIDRIHRERERARRQERAPLHIERGAPPRGHVPPADDRHDDEKQERGSVVIDFCV